MLFTELHDLVSLLSVVKTDRNLIFWLHELGSKVDQPIYQHLSNVSIFHKIAQNDGTWC